MLEVANTLVNKLSMKIVRSSGAGPNTDVGDIVLSLLYQQPSVLQWVPLKLNPSIFITSFSGGPDHPIRSPPTLIPRMAFSMICSPTFSAISS